MQLNFDFTKAKQMKEFLPKAIFYEKNIDQYPLGKYLVEKYKKLGVEFIETKSHNSIPEMQCKENKEFADMKRFLIIGVRKTHKYMENHKVSDFIAPYTSSGCTAMCMYCYLVCNYNKCAYLRLFVNREQMLGKVIETCANSEKELCIELGSNSDLVLENTITHNLVYTIEEFSKTQKGLITFPTKFHMVDEILPLNHKHKVIVRVSVNPQKIISAVELGTSSLMERIEAIVKLLDADYKVGILVAPIILVDNYQIQYDELLKTLYENIPQKYHSKLFFEVIFMTYGWVLDKINDEAFPNHAKIYDKNMMTGRGNGKYTYKKEYKDVGIKFIEEKLKFYFPKTEILYVV